MSPKQLLTRGLRASVFGRFVDDESRFEVVNHDKDDSRPAFQGQNSPPIWRRVIIPEDYTFGASFIPCC